MKPLNPYIVMTAAARMPRSCKFGTYRKVAVVKTSGIGTPKQIHPSHKSIEKIVWTMDRLNVGTTERCAYERALAEAKEDCRKLNIQHAMNLFK